MTLVQRIILAKIVYQRKFLLRDNLDENGGN
jgi:hypothetical protein